MDIILSSLISSGVGFAVATFLSKTLLTQLLKRDLEKYKSILDIEYKIRLESRSYALKQEIERMHTLWDLSYSIINECKSMSATSAKDDLSKLVTQLDTFLAKEKPFLTKKIYDTGESIANFGDPEQFDVNSIGQLLELEATLVNECRSLLYLDL